MAKNLSTFQPGSGTATKELEYYTDIYSSAWGAEDNGNAESAYGNMYTFIDKCATHSGKKYIKDKTHLWTISNGGQGGGSCCCMQGMMGYNGASFKYTPQWSDGDSDYIQLCQRPANKCCHPQSSQEVGAAGWRLCHLTGTKASPVIKQNLCALGACGGTTVCNGDFSNDCCNFGALNIQTNNFKWCCCQGTTIGVTALCFTTDAETPPSDCKEAGYDATLCRYQGPAGYEVGSCINRTSNNAIWKQRMHYTPIWKGSAYRQGLIARSGTYKCAEGMGGWMQRCSLGCTYGSMSAPGDYWWAGSSMMGANVTSSNCCCGSPGQSGITVIRYEAEAE
jgi:hypothetical protein